MENLPNDFNAPGSNAREERNIGVAYEIRRMEEETNRLKMELESCRKKQRNIDVEICEATHRKTEASLELGYAKLQNSRLLEDLNVLRERFKEINKYEYLEEAARRKIEELTGQKHGLEKELKELREIGAEKRRNLIETKRTIARQKKLNVALLRKVKRGLEDGNVSQELREKGNRLLNDPRVYGATSTISRDEK